jgi:hypothetical protein
MDQFHAANVKLSLAGHVVYSVATSTKGDFQPTEEQKIALDAVHLSKIEESDAIMVVGYQEDGSMYIGDSTKREIAFARMRDKNVYYFNPAQEIQGPNTDFLKDLKAAATTEAQREQERLEAEKQRAEYLASFQTKDDDDEDDVDHSGDPEKPAEEVVTN